MARSASIAGSATLARPGRAVALGVVALATLLPAAAASSQPAAAPAEHSVRLLEPPEGLQVGPLRVGAVVEGPGVARVQFLLDGRPVLAKRLPPFSVELDLGEAPRPHLVAAVAYDAAGRELARDRLRVNLGPHRFAVRLLSPVAGHRYQGTLPARAEPTLPIGEALERVDFFLGEELAGSATAPPWAADLALATGEQTYVRAVATLADGSTAEDLVAVNARSDMEELRISFVELFTSVLDRRRKPVDGLTRGDFAVTENGVPQTVRRFERVLDRPIHVGVLLDTSTSMTDELAETRRAALEFFTRILRPRDRATVITFADEPAVEVPFTSDLEALAAGLDDLEAEGETTLYDSLAFSLYYFGGLAGKRALVVLTDGHDSQSRFDQAQVVEFAQRLGVAVYPIGVDVGTRDFETESALRRLATATGGSAFFIQRARELNSAYERIEAELRSQYLLGYQSTSTVPGAFRQVEVAVAAPGLTAHTIPGYYP
ncbi:MAG: VWA domain-containing protein [Acidobacteriota bacterium]|nr:VWA domain-containing protein [Acidobacteriota bacterium]MDH3522402.1 VWA domain-containing protein [Acidobacteriota bacterium]